MLKKQTLTQLMDENNKVNQQLQAELMSHKSTREKLLSTTKERDALKRQLRAASASLKSTKQDLTQATQKRKALETELQLDASAHQSAMENLQEQHNLALDTQAEDLATARGEPLVILTNLLSIVHQHQDYTSAVEVLANLCETLAQEKEKGRYKSRKTSKHDSIEQMLPQLRDSKQTAEHIINAALASNQLLFKGIISSRVKKACKKIIAAEKQQVDNMLSAASVATTASSASSSA